MAIANFIPNSVFLLVDINVVIPSGILCSIKTIADIIPSLCSLLDDNFSSILSSIIVQIKIPDIIKIEHIKNEGIGRNVSDSKFDDSGIKDINDIDNIIPPAKASDVDMILFWFFALKKQGITPSVVDRPDSIVIIKLNIVLFIVIYMIVCLKK